MGGRSSDDKGRIFRGIASGWRYDLGSALLGFNSSFYRKAALAIPLRPGMRVLDLGCGTASLGLAIAERIKPGGVICGVDLSEDQLAYAAGKTAGCGVRFELQRCSIDELPFRDETFDAVASSLALHDMPEEVRRRAVAETSRVLRPGGVFALVDLARPRGILAAAAWLPLILHVKARDFGDSYPSICREAGLRLLTDTYVLPVVRCQVFEKPAMPGHGAMAAR